MNHQSIEKSQPIANTTKQNFLDILVKEGYKKEQIQLDYHTITNTEAIAIWKSVESKVNHEKPFMIACCYTNNHIKNDDYLEVENYALLADVQFFVTYYEQKQEEYTQPRSEVKVFKFIEEKPPLQVKELEEFPHASIANNEEELAKLLEKTKNYSKDEFKKLFFACHDIIRNNDKLSPEMAFDEISKILFIKIRFEKENNMTFKRDTFEKLGKDYQALFNETKEKYSQDKIFAPEDKLRVKELTFKQILGKLQAYNLAEIPEDIKGVAFEEFLGKTFRGELGQFFTPRTVVDFMVQVLEPQEGERICDPCCGSGGFLIRSFEEVKKKIVNNIRAEKAKFRKELLANNALPIDKINEQLLTIFRALEQELDNNNPEARLHRLSHYSIFGVDAEPRSARTAKINMIMQGDGHSGVHHHDGLQNINGIFENSFDVIITNPPFGASVSKDMLVMETDIILPEEKQKEYTNKYGTEWQHAYDNTLKTYKELLAKTKNKQKEVALVDFFETSSLGSSLTEVLFMERCIRLLRKGGRMGVVLPEGFLNGSNLQRVREFLEGKAKLLAVVSLPQDVFISAGATVKSSLVFLKRFTEEEEATYQKIQKAVENEVQAKYTKELADLKIYIKNAKGDERKKLKKQEIDLENTIKLAIRNEIKNKFDYEFPIIQVKYAGISSTGQKIENELELVRDEYLTYRELTKAWEGTKLAYTYTFDTEAGLIPSKKKVNF